MKVGFSAFLIGVSVAWVAAASFLAGHGVERRAAPVQTVVVVKSFPHDPAAYTQGLVHAGGEFFESTGLYGESSLRRVEIATGKVLQRRPVDDKYFAEGLALVGDALVQLTWHHSTGFVYDRKSFALRRTFSYATEGWGLAPIFGHPRH